MQESQSKSLVELTTQIVAAYAGQHSCSMQELPGIISAVYASLAKLGQPEEPAVEQKPPAVSIKKSITPDYLVCLEDGKKLKMLKRHLRTTYGMTPEEYRAKWGLPRDYPMVAPNYAQRRSEFAKSIGLGRSRKAPEPAPAKRGRKKVA
jgi:predicted transcriptional regulator